MERLGKGVKQFKINNEDTTTFSMTSFWQLYCQLRAYVRSFSSDSIVDFERVNVLGRVSLHGGVIGAWVPWVRPCCWVGIAWLAFSRRGSLAWCLGWGNCASGDVSIVAFALCGGRVADAWGWWLGVYHSIRFLRFF